jgi:GNAT superfamily N-acetyltransferase
MMRRVFAEEYDALAHRLGDTPETVIAVHLLQRRLCLAYAMGEPCRPDPVVIRYDHLPEEPVAFGPDAEAIWPILLGLRGWTCVNVDVQVARRLGPLMEADLGRSVRLVEDIYHTLERPVAAFIHPAVRPLARDDLALLEGSPAEVRRMALGFGSRDGLLDEGVAAGAVVDDRLVALACTTALTERRADLGIVTREEWRGQGLATACAALVADGVHRTGRVPVWSTGEDNHASLRVAQKLGFREVGRRAYLIPAHDVEPR